MKIFRSLILFFSVLLVNSIQAQIAFGGKSNATLLQTKNINLKPLKAGDVPIDQLIAEDKVTDKHKDIPYRFGFNLDVDIDFANEATWITENGTATGFLAVQSEGAMSLNFFFDHFELPAGSFLFISSPDGQTVLGGFTPDSNPLGSFLNTTLLSGDQAIIEVQVPEYAIDAVNLHLATVTHGYRSILNAPAAKAGPYGNSGNCNINVNCPEGDPWQLHKKSVALIVVNGNAACSGALVNNTAEDSTPYFLTADHCLGGNVNNWVFIFNHESSGCSGSNGPIDQSISGSTLRANNGDSDFALLELSSAPPASYDVTYAGWDNSDSESGVTGAVGIHHPSGDVKKICFEDDAPYHQDVFGAACWYIDEWELGVTEGGSSGSPLFSQDGYIIGQLYGGFAACAGSVNNGDADWYGRFGVSWDGPSASSRLRDWLDPENLNPTVWNSNPPMEVPDFELSLGQVGNLPDENACEAIPFEPALPLFNGGVQPIEVVQVVVEVSGETIYDSLVTVNLAAGASTTLELPEILLIPGLNELTFTVLISGQEEDAFPANNTREYAFTIAEDPAYVTLNLTTDEYPGETSWEIRDDETNTVIYTGGGGLDDLSNYNFSYCLENNRCYTFTIFDEFGDGICCEYGNGSFSISDDFGNFFGEGGEFAGQDVVEFCLFNTASTQNVELRGFSLYPNPAQDEVFIRSDEHSGLYEIEIFDTAGRLVSTAQTNITASAPARLSTTNLPKGVYLVSLRSAAGKSTLRLLIQ